jgi:3-phosphoshikimate 1-carboxyvinyltransferase
MVMSFAVTAILKSIPFMFRGTQSLKIKETDRIEALQAECYKLGGLLHYDPCGILQWDGKRIPVIPKDLVFKTYTDHRMAMAFAPVCFSTGKIIIEEPGVVVKSYPGFWDELRKLGVSIEEKPGFYKLQ